MSENTSFEPILTSREKRELCGEVFSRRKFVSVDLAGADLRGARFEEVLFERCNLEGADLRGAHFIRCELREVVMTDATLGDNRFEGTTLRGVVGQSASASADGGGDAMPSLAIDLREPLERNIEKIIEATLALEHGNRSRVAERLGVSVRTIQRYLARGVLEPAPGSEDKPAQAVRSVRAIN